MLNETIVNTSEGWHGFIKISVSEEPTSSKLVYSVALLIVFIASLIGNTLTCIVIYSDKTMHTATNCYLFNLAVSDLLASFPILVFIYQLLTEDTELMQYNYGVWTCKFLVCIHFVFITLLFNNGILVMTALSIERYIAVCYPMMLKGSSVWRRVGKIIAVIWTVAIFETLPDIAMIDVYDTGKTLYCFSLPSPSTKILSGLTGVLTFILPLTIMTFVYTMILFKVKDNNHDCNLKDTVLKNRYKTKKVSNLIALTVSFVVCWLPFFLMRTVMVVIDVEDFTQLHQWWAPAHKVGLFNSWFTTVLNPLLFSIMSTKFKKALKKLWSSRFRKHNVRSENFEEATQYKSATYYQH